MNNRLAHAVLLVALVPTCALSASSPLQYANGRLTGRLEEASLVEVLDDIARQAGIEIRGEPVDPPPISMVLDGVPLEEALPRLLAGQSFAFVFAGERLKGVTLLARSDSMGLIVVPRSPSVGPNAGESPAPERIEGETDIQGPLAQALHTRRASFSQLMGAMIRSPNPRIRADALKAVLRILNAEPELHATVLRMLDGINDAVLAGWLTYIAGGEAERIVRREARTARAGALRIRAMAMERYYLRAQGAGA